MISLTPVAIQRVKDLLAQRGTPELALRIGVRGGGCSGNSYYMEFCEAPGEGDAVLELDGVRVVVDNRSAAVLSGTQVDYVSGLMGAGFKFNNPNVRHQCACGESFTT